MSNARDALWASGRDESVEVNQRALIDKVLARYSEEFTVFRELLQNSDDATAKSVEIHFETHAYLDSKSLQIGNQASSSTDNILSAPLPDLRSTKVHQWTFKNDGIILRDEDWNRLKKIAEGNPDEEKIGAFGVGFYSLFSVTEEPFVTSGDQWMGFYWKDKKDQLFARRGTIPDAHAEDSRWTTFSMPLRTPEPLPVPFDFIRFLTSSITFMTHLSQVSVYFDGKRLACLRKDRGLPKAIALRKGSRSETPKGIMRLTEISVTPLSIKAEIMQWVYAAGTSKPRRRQTLEQQETRAAVSSGFFSSIFSAFGASRAESPHPEPVPVNKAEEREREIEERKGLLNITEAGVVLAVFSAQVDVKLDDSTRRELLRATKKNAPSRMKYELIYTGKEEYESSKKEEEAFQSTGSIFQGLRADIDGTGAARVFIGHSTRQTTGIGGHMSARFIPTVERESIDLVDRNVRVWNEELLAVGGYLARAAYEQEMETINAMWKATTSPAAQGPADDLQKLLQDRALHALKFYTFHTSTPSPQVSAILEESFFANPSQSYAFLRGAQITRQLPIISTVGIRDASEVRMPSAAFSTFLKQLPMLPEDVVDNAKEMIATIRSRGMIKEITFADVLQELRARPLREDELISCFRWWIGLQKTLPEGQMLRARTELINVTILSSGALGTAEEKNTPLSSIQTYLNAKNNIGAAIATDGPLPSHMLPLSISRNFDAESLKSAFGWHDLSIGEWFRHILDNDVISADVEHDLTKSPVWAERVLTSLARPWSSLGKDVQADVIGLLHEKPCIPTSAGMKTPGEAYFQNVQLFPDLPLVTLPSVHSIKGPLEKVLEALGVRKHVELQLVFDRMIKTGDWSTADLIEYLGKVQSTLTPDEVERLRRTAAFPKEDAGVSNGKVTRYKASDLYEPLQIFRQLGLPLIDWGSKSKWKGSSDEAKFLYRLGLRRYPSLEVILGLAAGADEKNRSDALKYFLDNYATKYSDYNPSSFSQVAFIPALKGSIRCIAKPGEVFSSSMWTDMGFLVADPSLSTDALSKLKVREHPPTAMLVSLLEKNPPESVEAARQWFSALASRIAEFSSKELHTLSQLLIVPIENTSGEKTSMRMMAPGQCYFKRDTQGGVHSKLFTFVDFGTQANQFLSACGTKHEPTVEEIAQILLDNPSKFYQLAEGRDNFLTELRNIAVNRRLLSSGTILRMKRSPIFLGIRRKRREQKNLSKKDDLDLEEEEEHWDYEYDLLQPNKVVLADDTNAYQLFGDIVFTCPQEDLLEEFYAEFGSRRLSSMVKEEYRTSGEIRGSKKATTTRSLILERLPLFLHEHTHTQTRVPITWLNTANNFVVRTFGKLIVIKTLTYGEINAVKNQDASAVAMREGRGPIQLWLADHDNVDMYEVSTSMCRLLFASPRASDALLFMTILSTDLRALRRRGYNVDRILQRQRAERQAAEDAAREHAKRTELVSQSLMHHDRAASIPPEERPHSPEGSIISTSSETTVAEEHTDKGKSRPQSMLKDSISNWKRKLRGDNAENAVTRPETDSPSSPLLMPPRPSPSRPGTPSHNQGVTPMSNIAANINMAIRACREERSELLKSKEQMKIVTESLNDSYCDISGQKDMSLAGEMGGIKVFMARDVSQPQALLKTKKDSVARFIHIIKPLGEVYGLPSTSLHIFYDLSGGVIAFNRNASLFLNLRFFEAWHDEEVRNGEFRKAFISWYFTLAHEIAHNLVQPHNAEHEFWFSSLCEAHLPAFSRLLDAPTTA